MTNLVSPAGAFNYTYAFQPASSLVTGLSLPTGANIANSYDTLARLHQTALNNYWGHTLDGYTYTPDPLGLRTNILRNLGLTSSEVSVGYDKIGQLISWTAQETNATPRLNEQLGFGFDAADNLHLRTNNALQQTFTVDAANQLSSVTRTGTFTVSGATPAPATSVLVNGQTAQTYGDFTFSSANNTLANGVNTFAIIAQNVYGVSVTNNLTVNLPSSVGLNFDNNGNLTNDGTRSFAFDCENQLTNVTIANSYQKNFAYDGLNRLRIKREYGWIGGTWVQTNEVHFIYDDGQVIQLRNSNNVPTLTLTRGLDFSGSVQGAGFPGQITATAGGIGGLLAMTEGSGTTSYYHSDGIGNVTALMDANENIVARREYDPFGRTILLSGTKAGINPYWFSSQLHDEETDLYHYMHRPYTPTLQRWLNRDPMGEDGGMNLYNYVANGPINWIDPYGLSQEGAEAAYGETSSLYPQLTTLPKGQAHKQDDIYRPSDWDPTSYQNLQAARQYIADIRERNKQTRMKDGSKSKNDIEKKAWSDCEAAAKKAESSTLADGIDQFTIRQGPIIPGQHDPTEPGFTPTWSAGLIHYQEGPFINTGGGDVPKGPDTYIDYWQKPRKSK
jgi:RHS repeat-associated protein